MFHCVNRLTLACSVKVKKMSEDGEVPLYCLCQKPYDDTIFMIECDICLEWFHGG